MHVYAKGSIETERSRSGDGGAQGLSAASARFNAVLGVGGGASVAHWRKSFQIMFVGLMNRVDVSLSAQAIPASA